MTHSNHKPRTAVQRGRKRAIDDVQTAYDILDDSLLCHVAQMRNGHPVVTPTCHWRHNDRLYWHGHAKAFNVVGSQNAQVCINVSQLDGLVMARSAFHHSVNYRSVTVFGEPNIVEDDAEKSQQLQHFIEKVSPGRWQQLRPINEKELMITSVAWLPLDEFSVKVRSDGVNDDEADLDWPVWAGVIPIEKRVLQGRQEAQPDYPQPELPTVFKYQVYQ